MVLQYLWGQEAEGTFASGATGGNFTLMLQPLVELDIENVTSSGSYVVSVGTTAIVVWATKRLKGHLQLTLQPAVSAVTITGVTAGGNLTISMGAGTGALTLFQHKLLEISLLTLQTLVVRLMQTGTVSSRYVSVGTAGDSSAQERIKVTLRLTLVLQQLVQLVCWPLPRGNITISMAGTGGIVLTSELPHGFTSMR